MVWAPTRPRFWPSVTPTPAGSDGSGALSTEGRMKLHAFITSPDLCGAEFTAPSWAVHREVLARLWDGDPDLIPPEHHAVARQLLGCELPQPGAPAEMYLAFGRRSGKN